MGHRCHPGCMKSSHRVWKSVRFRLCFPEPFSHHHACWWLGDARKFSHLEGRQLVYARCHLVCVDRYCLLWLAVVFWNLREACFLLCRVSPTYFAMWTWRCLFNTFGCLSRSGLPGLSSSLSFSAYSQGSHLQQIFPSCFEYLEAYQQCICILCISLSF